MGVLTDQVPYIEKGCGFEQKYLIKKNFDNEVGFELPKNLYFSSVSVYLNKSKAIISVTSRKNFTTKENFLKFLKQDIIIHDIKKIDYEDKSIYSVEFFEYI